MVCILRREEGAHRGNTGRPHRAAPWRQGAVLGSEELGELLQGLSRWAEEGRRAQRHDHARVRRERKPARRAALVERKEMKCERCGGDLRTGKRFCSLRCAGQAGGVASARAAAEKRERFVCQNPSCGKVFLPKHAQFNKYCGRPCAFEHRRATPAAPKRPELHPAVCVHCNRSFKSIYPTAAHCSTECRRKRASAKASTRYAVSDDRKRRQSNRIVHRACAWCGVAFDAPFPGKPRRYCSERCLAKHHKANRKAVKRGAFVAPVFYADIWKRDNGRCQICGGQCKRTRVSNEPEGGTLDHIIPLSKGGTHEPKNVQLAHRRCNVDKRDRVGPNGDQLRLVG